MALIAPAYNEEGKIGRVVEKVAAVAPRLPCDLRMVVVDDGSTDGTAAEAGAAGAVVLRHERNRGVGAGIRTGIDWARENHFDVAAVISGDDQHVPEELGRLLAPLVEGKADFVQGSRWMPGGRVENIPVARRVLTRAYAWMVRLFLGCRCTDGTNGLRAFRLSILDDPRINLWQSWLDTYELEPYVLYQAIRTGVRLVEVPCTVRYHSRRAGFTKMRAFRDWWRILRPLVLLKLRLRS
ncbi:MAG TPA: glycosyltransferase family 2 protein [Planctomycetota bacterium]|nr:glycosyltransferase family 2 protein [Planctomycetota bacterium]